MRLTILKGLTTLVLVISHHFLFAQKSQEEYVAYFDSLLGVEHLGLIAGFDYKPPPYSRNSHPFYNTKNWVTGNIEVNGFKYYNVLLKYDLVKQEVILKKVANGLEYPVTVKFDRLNGFLIGSSEFSMIAPKEGNKFLAIEHFNGQKFSLYEVFSKSGEIDHYTKVYQYKLDRELLLSVDNILHPYTGKKTIKQFTPTIKKELKQYIKSNKLNLRDENTSEIVKLLGYVESL